MAMKACFWFVHPLDAGTDTVIANLFEGRTDDHFHFDKECKDGVRRHLWECPHDKITHLKANAKSLGLRFEIFRRRGLYGPIERWCGRKTQQATSASPSVIAGGYLRNQGTRHKLAVAFLSVSGVIRGSRLPLPRQVG